MYIPLANVIGLSSLILHSTFKFFRSHFNGLPCDMDNVQVDRSWSGPGLEWFGVGVVRSWSGPGLE